MRPQGVPAMLALKTTGQVLKDLGVSGVKNVVRGESRARCRRARSRRRRPITARAFRIRRWAT